MRPGSSSLACNAVQAVRSAATNGSSEVPPVALNTEAHADASPLPAQAQAQALQDLHRHA